MRQLFHAALALIAGLVLAGAVSAAPVLHLSGWSASAGKPETFTITRIGGNGPAAVSFKTVDGTAHAGSDYVATVTSIAWKQGQTSATVNVATFVNSALAGQRLSFTGSISYNGVASTAAATIVEPAAPPVVTPPPPASSWAFCAGDPGTCNTTAPANVRYGVNSSWIVKASPGSIICGGLPTWGSDPALGISKHCETDGTPVLPVTGCQKPMTYGGITACTEINFTKPPVEEADVVDGLPRDSTTIAVNPGGGALNQYVPDDTVGAWRAFGKVSWVGRADPIMHFGEPGAGHIHIGICNSLPNGANTDYNLLRSTGTSTCAALARVGIWMNAPIDVVQQVVKLPKKVYYYYKQLPPGHPGCTDPVKKRGICIDLPLGHKWKFGGINAATMTGGITDPNSFDYWLQGFYCGSDDAALQAKINAIGATGRYHSFKEIADAGCPIGATLSIVFWGPDCSDGRIDSPDHSSHVSYATGPDLGYGRICAPPFNYLMPEMQFNWQWTVTSDLHNWCFSSEVDMKAAGMNVTCGADLHMDYWNGWARDVRDAWEQCIRKWLSCASGDLGNGTMLIGADGGGTFPETVDIPLSRLQGGVIVRP